MSELSPISIDGFAPVGEPPPGPAPQLAWIEIEDLVVDLSYQREILKTGRRNVQKIAEAFDWACFAPVIVAPVEGGKFAIVDGQHRTTAAALVGKKSIPCQIIVADAQKQARAFAAVNGATTRMHSLQVFHAALKAGDRDAIALNDLCARAGVRILSTPRQRDRQKPGDTMAVAGLQRLRARFGDEIVFLALVALTAFGGDTAGWIVAEVMGALCQLLAAKPLSEAAVRAVFRAIDLQATIKEARRREGFSFSDDLRQVIVEKLAAIASRGRAA